MKIEEILENAGIEDAEAVAKVVAEMPKNFMPLAEANKRIGEAKKAADELKNEYEQYKQEVEEAAKNAADDGNDETAKELEAIKAKYSELETKFTESQQAIQQRDAMSVLTKQLKDAGANPAALELLAANALGSVEFGEDGKPANVDAVVDTVKTANAGLFGEAVATSTPPAKSDADVELESAFDEGFGEVKRD